MKFFCSLLLVTFVHFAATAKERTFIGSTPAHYVIRNFLGISLTDSIDFIRWELVIRFDGYDLRCAYGLSKPSTPGFWDEKRVQFSGKLYKEENRYYLEHNHKSLLILEINSNLFHLLDEKKNLLVGNGGYSYTLNNKIPRKKDEFNLQLTRSLIKSSMVFEGRTPCQELSGLLGLHKSAACDKMKWYFIFYVDSLTGKPSHYLTGGTGYRKETMDRGKWEIISGRNGRIIYKLNPDKQAYSLYLLKADENILFFIDPEGNLLVGNENFSYTLNKRYKEYPPVSR